MEGEEEGGVLPIGKIVMMFRMVSREEGGERKGVEEHDEIVIDDVKRGICG